MTDNTPDIPLGSWLAELSDERLIRLLELRPDLAQPPPGSIAALAARAQARQSIKAATDDLDFLRLAVLDALLVLQADVQPVPTAKLLALIGERAAETEILDALDDLRQRVLVWGDGALQVAADAGSGMPWHPGQVILEDSSRSAEQIAALIDDLDPAQLDVLEKLLEGSPMGRTRDAAPGAPADRPVPQLLAMGLLRRLDAETVILPRHVGQVLRGEQPGPLQLSAPDPVVSTTTAEDADAAAAGAVIDLLRELDVLLETLSAAPVSELRSGGLGVREVKRLSKTTGIDEQRLGLILEVAAAAGLIASGMPDPEPATGEAPYWAPTTAADRFAALSTAERWQLLAGSWLDLPGRPALIGGRGPDGKPYGALTDALYSTAAPLDRRLLLGMLSDLPPGAGVDATSASAALIWRRPRWAKRLQPEPVADLLREAHALGLVGRGAISTPARALLEEDADPQAAIDAMARALPKPVDHFLVQADLTVVVPGPLQRDLAEELATVATVESAGAAMVYRVSEQSIRHALDIGKTRDWMHAFFADHSKTPVPQGLTYLIDDVARRHGQLRIGMAASFVRCEDPALLAQAVAAPATEDVALRTLAPTVAVSPAPIGEVLAALRAAGFAPAAEDSTGAIVDVRPRGARVATPQQRRAYRPVRRPNTESLHAVVAVLRRVTAAPFGNVRVDPALTMTVLQRAAKEQDTLVIGYLDAAGVATQRVVSPISVRGGQLVAFDSASGRLRDFAIHRITSVVSATGR
ncbi:MULTISPECIES: helicase-associated domain-containing protein [Mycobacterium avium complex (MAC)]|uniref:DNA-binding protein n=2 Tax=Mycobacterium avium complex (MAC) TaxID=120793 RepID=A0AAW5SDD6_MYCBC|nr:MULTISPECIES: helicase-associated domain-containing protein [Mycobacterium avium complex (MAC)]ETZ46604.1 helicase conserved C-terminal domain protein [Mycobacterium avium MAV_061107_1842]KDP01877.1 DNA-binding protein [Mycobacterium avium subsp. hominissuis 3388]MBZ4611092.1 DNA-binding protein [Mycobacterium avium subsp. hominissuis]MCV6993060.1 helicase-associated domain-containing protein [Mycobacterium bouchedurhonense]MCV6996981.1 helicase-associated domain-containing protein [Mycobac